MKKRLIALALAALLVFGTVPTFALALVRGAYVFTDDGKTLNMRQTPSTEFPPIAHIPYGTYVHIEDYIENTWVRIEYNGLQGYVMGYYLWNEQPPPRPQPTRAPTPTYAPVPVPTQKPAPKPTQKPGNSDSASVKQIFSGFGFTRYDVRVYSNSSSTRVHMRWAPTRAADIIQDYHLNDPLTVIAQNSTWAQVVDPLTGVTGFMMREFLTDFGVGINYDGES